jgi:hypothetical protein
MRSCILAFVGLAFGGAAFPALAQDPSQAARQQTARRGAEDQWQLHRNLTDFRWISGAELTKRVAAYRKETELHRLNALQIAEQAATNPLPVGTGPRIREALQADLDFWRNELQVSQRDYDLMRKQWLVPAASLTDQQWAMQRANWFKARDAWLDQRVQTAENARP